MFRLTNETALFSSAQRRRPTNFARHILVPICHAHSLCCSYSLLVPSITAQLGLHIPSCTPCRSCSPCVGLLTTVQTRKPTESPPRPASHHATNTVSLANDICRGAVDRPSLTPVPRRRSPASVHMDAHFAPRYACFLGLAIAKAPLCHDSTWRKLGRMSTRCRNRFSGLR